MAHRFRRSVVAAALLATVLSLAGPVEAGGRSRVRVPEGLFERAVSWVLKAWEMVVPGGGVADTKSNAAAPSGGGAPQADACTSNCDKGSGVDPNG